MKYETSITVNLPRDRFLEILEDPDGMKLWQPGLVSYEFLDEVRTDPGVRMRLEYDTNGRKITMLETLVDRSLPASLTFTYEAKGVWNKVINSFTRNEDGTTTWTQHNEFCCGGFMAIICFLMPGAFRKETMKSLELFKTYAEGL